jgi:nanoRNase/pAp phosphatase (c-di-AMP/oligoRNAs hydrolase)
MSVIQSLIDFLKTEEIIFIQTHNFPDHDAVASAFGLQRLFENYGIKSNLIYEGDLQRDSLSKMIKALNIVIANSSSFDLKEKHKIIVIDGCKGNKNLTDLIGEEVAVIDHHEVKSPDDVRFTDIRKYYGACSTIINSYYEELGVPVPRDVATALMIGINMDTALLTRGVSEEDVTAYADLYPIADIPLQNSLLRNYIQTKDLDFYRFAINKVAIKKGVAFCYFPEGCNQNLLGILGDFFLALEEVHFVILCANNENTINFSLRNENEDINASLIIQDVLKGIGFGGGHQDLAGGLIQDKTLFNADAIYSAFMKKIIKSASQDPL